MQLLWTGEHNVCRVVGHQSWSVPTVGDSLLLCSYPATPADTVSTSAACRCRWCGDDHRSCGLIRHRGVTAAAVVDSDCCRRSDDTLAPSVHCKCSGSFRWCTLVMASFVYCWKLLTVAYLFYTSSGVLFSTCLLFGWLIVDLQLVIRRLKSHKVRYKMYHVRLWCQIKAHRYTGALFAHYY